MLNNHDIICVFGGSGFLGKVLVEKLARTGAMIKVISTHPKQSIQLNTSGNYPGQVNCVYGDITQQESVEDALKGCTHAINLVGILHAPNANIFKKVHTDGASNIAKASKKVGIKSLVHISALGVDHSLNSIYAKSKLNGEKAVLKYFPDATILRPSVIFGSHDSFLNRFADMTKYSPFLPLIGGGKTKFQPVYVNDVAEAILRCLQSNSSKGRIFELGGDKVYSFKEIMEFILSTLKKERLLVTIPFSIAYLQAIVLEQLPNPLLTRDQVKLLKSDNIVRDKENNFKALGIKPASMEVIAPSYLTAQNNQQNEI